MSFVPAPQQANAASNQNASNPTNGAPAAAPGAAVVPAAAAAAAAAPELSDQERLFKLRTFDVFWVDKKSLMYRDGIAKVSSYDLSDDLLRFWSFTS